MTGVSALRVDWSRKAESDLAKLAQRDFDRVQAAVRRFAEYRHGDVQRVRRGESVRYRLKAGSFRVIFGREEDGIRVHRVHHRRGRIANPLGLTKMCELLTARPRPIPRTLPEPPTVRKGYTRAAAFRILVGRWQVTSPV